MKLTNRFVKVNVNESSNKWKNVRYNPATNVLNMTFLNTKKPITYSYTGVKPKVIKKWEKTEVQGDPKSSGKFFYHKIRSNYEHTVVDNGGNTVIKSRLPVEKVENKLPNILVFKPGQKFYLKNVNGITRTYNVKDLIDKGLGRFETKDETKARENKENSKPEVKNEVVVSEEKPKVTTNETKTVNETKPSTDVKEQSKEESAEEKKRRRGFSVGKAIAVGTGAAAGSFLGGLGRRY